MYRHYSMNFGKFFPQNHNFDEKGYFLETAHPVKFEVGSIVEEDIELPVTIQSMFNKDKKTLRMKAGAEELKEFLLSRQISP